MMMIMIAVQPSRLSQFPERSNQAFERVAEPFRRELKLYCYRMLHSLYEADDLAQETYLRAWRSFDSFDGSGSIRAWLYQIATNAWLNALANRKIARRVLPDQQTPAIVQQLPPRQRVALLLCDVLGWAAAEAATLFGGSTASVNSALQRARETLAKRYPDGRPLVAPQSDLAQQKLLDRYLQAWEGYDIDGFVAFLKEDAAFTMPPRLLWYVGREAIGSFFAMVWKTCAGLRLVPTAANRQPAFAVYERTDTDPRWNAHSIHVLALEHDKVSRLTTFLGPDGLRLFPAFGLPLIFHDDAGANSSRHGYGG